jgi:hypothetical protein
MVITPRLPRVVVEAGRVRLSMPQPEAAEPGEERP